MPADKKKDKQGDRSRSKERRSAAAAAASEEAPASPPDIAATLAQILANQNDMMKALNDNKAELKKDIGLVNDKVEVMEKFVIKIDNKVDTVSNTVEGVQNGMKELAGRVSTLENNKDVSAASYAAAAGMGTASASATAARLFPPRVPAPSSAEANYPDEDCLMVCGFPWNTKDKDRLVWAKKVMEKLPMCAKAFRAPHARHRLSTVCQIRLLPGESKMFIQKAVLEYKAGEPVTYTDGTGFEKELYVSHSIPPWRKARNYTLRLVKDLVQKKVPANKVEDVGICHASGQVQYDVEPLVKVNMNNEIAVYPKLKNVWPEATATLLKALVDELRAAAGPPRPQSD